MVTYCEADLGNLANSLHVLQDTTDCKTADVKDVEGEGEGEVERWLPVIDRFGRRMLYAE